MLTEMLIFWFIYNTEYKLNMIWKYTYNFHKLYKLNDGTQIESLVLYGKASIS